MIDLINWFLLSLRSFSSLANFALSNFATKSSHNGQIYISPSLTCCLVIGFGYVLALNVTFLGRNTHRCNVLEDSSSGLLTTLRPASLGYSFWRCCASWILGLRVLWYFVFRIIRSSSCLDALSLSISLAVLLFLTGPPSGGPTAARF